MNDTGRFTMPGEAGYESLTLELARKWGADVIRDSDGTTLSDEILDAGYGIYSTVCLIRDHNEWAAAHPHALQQTFLMTQPVVASSDTLTIDLMKDFFAEQFRINGDEDAMPYWQGCMTAPKTGCSRRKAGPTARRRARWRSAALPRSTPTP